MSQSIQLLLFGRKGESTIREMSDGRYWPEQQFFEAAAGGRGAAWFLSGQTAPQEWLPPASCLCPIQRKRANDTKPRQPFMLLECYSTGLFDDILPQSSVKVVAMGKHERWVLQEEYQ